jgi:hypothetical protein
MSERSTKRESSKKFTKKKKHVDNDAESPMESENVEDVVENIDINKLLEKRDRFMFDICKSMAKVIIDQEKILYTKIPSNKIKLLNTKKIKKVIIKSLEDFFNKIYADMIKNKKFTNEEYNTIVNYFGHSKLGFIHLFSSECVQVHMNIKRDELIVNSESEYINSFSSCVNDELNENYEELTHKFISELENEAYDDRMLNDSDIKKNIKPFNFKIELEE